MEELEWESGRKCVCGCVCVPLCEREWERETEREQESAGIRYFWKQMRLTKRVSFNSFHAKFPQWFWFSQVAAFSLISLDSRKKLKHKRTNWTREGLMDRALTFKARGPGSNPTQPIPIKFSLSSQALSGRLIWSLTRLNARSSVSL